MKKITLAMLLMGLFTLNGCALLLGSDDGGYAQPRGEYHQHSREHEHD